MLLTLMGVGACGGMGVGPALAPRSSTICAASRALASASLRSNPRVCSLRPGSSPPLSKPRGSFLGGPSSASGASSSPSPTVFPPKLHRSTEMVPLRGPPAASAVAAALSAAFFSATLRASAFFFSLSAAFAAAAASFFAAFLKSFTEGGMQVSASLTA